MDPNNPSDSKAMAMVMDTNSEAWSTASSTIIDTQSEPPRCQGREADKIRMRATSAHQPTLPPLTSKLPRTAQPQPPPSSSSSVSSSGGGSLAAKLESNKQCRNSASSKASKSTSKSSRVAGHKSSKTGSKVSSVAAIGNSNASGVRSKKPNHSSSRSTTSSITASVATKEVIASKKKKSSVSASKTSSAGSRQRSAGNNSGSHGHTSHISGASKTTKAKTEPSYQSNSNTRRNSRDPEETTARSSTHPDKSSSHGHNQSYNSNSNTSNNNNPPPFSHALVPVPPPSRPAPSNHRLLDPPSAGEYTSSTASSTAELIESYDPPSTIDSFGYTKSYAPKQQQDDETRNSRASSQNRSSVEESMLTDDGLESRMMDTTLPTYADERESSRATSVSTSPSSEGWSRISEEEEEEESYYSDEENSQGGSESGSEVERALAIREENHSEGTSTRGDDGEDENAEFKDSHALVQNDYYDGAANSSYDEDREGDVAIVPGTNDASRYLSKAVDNHQAIVPIDSSVYEAYDHTFVTCPEHLRFRFLYTFLKKNLDKKVMIFFSTSNSAKFHSKLLGHFHVPTLTMHGKQSREKFISRFFKFSDWDTGILCATDAAGRDLDIPPSVDWVVQFEPPDDPSEYILRVARISCDSDRVGRSLLFLNPGEQGFLKYYHSASIPVSEFEIPKNKLADVQSHIEYHVNENERLLALSRDAYGSYLISYASHGFRDVYNVHDLNKNDVASAFGLVGLPSEVDDMTLDTKTLAVSTYGDAGEGLPTRSGGGSNSKGRKIWQKEEKQQTKSWMRGEKSWPHSQIKMHPKFKEKNGEDVGY